MKKKSLILLFIIFYLLFFTGASPWEGAAVTAPDGELPSKGLFVATNSFPINTIVEILNIETNKSTRAIVAKGLDSPGLLAVVSVEAADLIGMRQGSISRVRMVQPSDPIAYLRFIEGQAQGIPPYDSGNVMTEDNLNSVIVIPPHPVQPAPQRSETGPSYLLEPEWRRDEIITLYGEEAETHVITEERKELDYIAKDIIIVPDYIVPEYITEEYKELGYFEKEFEAEPEYITEEYKELLYFEKEFEEPEYITEEYKELLYFEKEFEEPEYITEEYKELLYFEKEFEESEYIAEEYKELDYFGKELDEEPDYIVEENKELDYFEKESGEPDYIAEEHKELGYFGKELDEEPDYIVEENKELDYFEKESDYIAEEHKELDEFGKVQYAIVPAPERPPDDFYGIDPKDLFPETPKPQITEKSEVPDFSVPRVTKLDNGFYYVQIASHDSPESVENTLNKIDHSYNPVVLNASDTQYQVLLGPMNQGESAAVLARFKSIGYRDAFVRYAR